jgi:hypothetical protein
MSILTGTTIENRRRLMLHLKCLFWCLHQLNHRYDLNMVLYSLERHSVHPGIADSNLGDNVSYLLQNLETEDLPRVAHALKGLSGSVASLDIVEKHFEIGHYVQVLKDFGEIKAGTYGIISAITPQLRGLFYMDDEAGLLEAAFYPSSVGVIFGTYIV